MITLCKSDKIYTILFFKETQNDSVSEVHIKGTSNNIVFSDLIVKGSKEIFPWLLHFLYKSGISDKVSLDHLKFSQGTATLWMVF